MDNFAEDYTQTMATNLVGIKNQRKEVDPELQSVMSTMSESIRDCAVAMSLRDQCKFMKTSCAAAISKRGILAAQVASNKKKLDSVNALKPVAQDLRTRLDAYRIGLGKPPPPDDFTTGSDIALTGPGAFAFRVQRTGRNAYAVKYRDRRVVNAPYSNPLAFSWDGVQEIVNVGSNVCLKPDLCGKVEVVTDIRPNTTHSVHRVRFVPTSGNVAVFTS